MTKKGHQIFGQEESDPQRKSWLRLWFRTGGINIVKSCPLYFLFNLLSMLLKNCAEKFVVMYISKSFKLILPNTRNECYHIDATQFVWTCGCGMELSLAKSALRPPRRLCNARRLSVCLFVSNFI